MDRIYLILALFLSPIFLIAQNDTIPPDIFCPPPDTVTLGPGGDCTFQFFFSVVSSDNESGDTLVQVSGLESGADFPIGTTNNVFVATDASGNTASCSFQLTVQNYAGPLSCKNSITVSLDSTCAWIPAASDLLQGNAGCTASGYYKLEVDKSIPYGNGPWLPAEFGSGDIGKTYVFRVTDTVFNYSCTGDIQINDNLPPVIACQDITISCAVDNVSPYFLNDSIGIAAAVPVASDACGQLMLTHTDSTVDSVCPSGVVGIIKRNWKAQDNFGNSSFCLQQIFLTRPVISDLQYPPDATIDCANPDVSPSNTGQPYIEFAGRKWTNTCSLGTAFNDSTFQLCPGISQVIRTWFVIDWCNGDALEKVQIITLNDAVGPAFLNCPANVTVSASTSNCVANVNLPDFIIADACSYATDISAYWVIDSVPGLLVGALSDFPGNDTTQSDTLAVFGTAPGFPAGIHVISYTAVDACGSTSVCTFNLHVWDSVPPVVSCLQFAQVALQSVDTTSFSAKLLNNGSTDNCGLLTYKARRAAPSGCQSNDLFYDTMQFCCSDLGDTLDFVLRVYDVFVPADSVPLDFAVSQSSDCLFRVFVVDPDSLCNDFIEPFSVAGEIKTENTTPVVNVKVTLTVNPSAQGPVFQTLTDIDGIFSFNTPLFSDDDYTLAPYKNTSHLDGVSTFDLVLISKHILGLESLGSPYKMIAADANHSNTITTFDVVEIRKLILGIYDSLPNNKSWRFIDKDYVFADPANPFLTPYPETITRTGPFADSLGNDFIGIKTGDVNGTAIGDPLLTADDRTEMPLFGGGRGGTLFFNVKNRDVEAGEAFTVQFAAAEKVEGWQFTLNTTDLEVLDVIPGRGMTAANFAVFPGLPDGQTGAVTTSVDVPAASAVAPAQFAITFRAVRAGRLSDMLAISSKITRAEAYGVIKGNYSHFGNDLNDHYDLLNIALRFDDGPMATPGFKLNQNRPNPVQDNTTIGFNLPEDAEATLSIIDETGRILYTQSGFYRRGHSEIVLGKALFDQTGVLFYKLETATDCAVRKMVVMRR